ncbi:RNA polymerase sigma factor [Chitinophaga nivalis]|uniref:RNA polymerase sigma factor n=1 Tax=Chitinophaga nivalis TaxID=2991709 RepID=A0ABT3IP01_9BACT|nr:RNA polymerase sigma factor [Chitinophaga nivalis]MCW3464608.1 RNA polymerase sigma factor [Chitinophaga nivalis]MCW3485701.1 RNA polymerase sigma factor [Chitinophaga nivalis]
MSNHYNAETADWLSFQQGDKRALSACYNTYADYLYNYGCKFTADTTLVEDTIQDLFLKLWKNRENLGQPASVKNYLLKSLRGLLIRKITTAQRHAPDELEESNYSFMLELSPEHIRMANEQAAQRSLQLKSALENLTPRQKEAVFLRFYEDMSYEDISEILSITIKATYKIMARALDALHEQLGQPL